MEMQIKTLMRYYLRPVKTALQRWEDKRWQGCRGKETLTHCSERIDVAAAENNPEVPQKLKIELQYDPAIPPLGIYPLQKKQKILIWKDSGTPMFIAALFTIPKIGT